MKNYILFLSFFFFTHLACWFDFSAHMQEVRKQFDIIEKEMSALFKNTQISTRSSTSCNTPHISMDTTQDAYILHITLPGSAKQDNTECSFSFDEDKLHNKWMTISLKSKQAKHTKHDNTSESYKSIHEQYRSIQLPHDADIDHVKHEQDGHVITLTIPKLAITKRTINIKI